MLQAGYARGEILPPGERELIGMYARRPRIAKRVRDPLWARALALSAGERQVVLVACDLLCVSEELHLAVGAELDGLGPAGLILAGTHSHSSIGGFFRSAASAAMLGAPRPEVFDFLVARISAVAREALADRAPARALSASVEVPGLTASRRQADGPHDDRLSLLRLLPADRPPIDLLSSSGHPVVVSEREPLAVSADYPGMLCRALEAAGSRPLFASAALGGVSILFPEFAMDADRHLELLRSLLVTGHGRAVAALQPVAGAEAGPQVDFFHVAHPPADSRIFASLGAWGRLADGLVGPARAWLSRPFARALPNPAGVPVHLVRLGDFALVASAAELGVGLVLALRVAAQKAGRREVQVISLADGYAGYTHLPEVYGRWPERGYRFLALYENALGLFGHEQGRRLLEAVEGRLRAG